MHRLSFVAVAYSLTVAACQPAATDQSATRELTEDQKAAIVQAVNAIHTEQVDAWEALDLDLIMTYWYDSPDATYVVGRRVLRGLEAIRTTVVPVAERYSAQVFTVAEAHTSVLAPDVAIVIERGTYAMADLAGNFGQERPYVITVVYALRDGDWKTVSIHES